MGEELSLLQLRKMLPSGSLRVPASQAWGEFLLRSLLVNLVMLMWGGVGREQAVGPQISPH